VEISITGLRGGHGVFLITKKVLDARRHKPTVQGARLKVKGKNALSDD
jgi:hypothetical protein